MAKLKDMTNTVVTRAKAGRKAVNDAATATSKAVTAHASARRRWP